MSSTIFPICVDKVSDFLDTIQYVRSRVIVKTKVWQCGKRIFVRFIIRKKKSECWHTISISVVEIENETDLHILSEYIELKQNLVELLYMTN